MPWSHLIALLPSHFRARNSTWRRRRARHRRGRCHRCCSRCSVRARCRSQEVCSHLQPENRRFMLHRFPSWLAGFTFLKKMAAQIPHTIFWAKFSMNLAFFPRYPLCLFILLSTDSKNCKWRGPPVHSILHPYYSFHSWWRMRVKFEPQPVNLIYLLM